MSDFSTSPRSHDLLLIGGGAAALGALCALIRTGEAEDRSILMLDDAPSRCGRPGAYARSYDIPVQTLLHCLEGLPAYVTEDAELAEVVQALGAKRDRVPRPQVEAFLGRLKRLVLNYLRREGNLILRASRCDTLRFDDDLWRVDNQPGSESRRVVLACGASEKKTDILATLLEAGLTPDSLGKIIPSTEALGSGREALLQQLVRRQNGPSLIFAKSQLRAEAVRDQLRDWAGERVASGVELMTMTDGTKASRLDRLNEAGVVITALGETPNFPRVLVEGQLAKLGGRDCVDIDQALFDRTGMALPNAQATGPALAAESEDAGEMMADWFQHVGEAIAYGIQYQRDEDRMIVAA